MKLIHNLCNFKYSLISAIVILCSCANAANNTQEIVTEDSVNLSAKIFLKEFVSQDLAARKAARLYALGVMDASEGKSWCDYKTLKTVTLNEFIFEHMKTLSPAKLDRRASVVIEEALQKTFPCGAKK